MTVWQTEIWFILCQIIEANRPYKNSDTLYFTKKASIKSTLSYDSRSIDLFQENIPENAY